MILVTVRPATAGAASWRCPGLVIATRLHQGRLCILYDPYCWGMPHWRLAVVDDDGSPRWIRYWGKAPIWAREAYTDHLIRTDKAHA